MGHEFKDPYEPTSIIILHVRNIYPAISPLFMWPCFTFHVDKIIHTWRIWDIIIASINKGVGNLQRLSTFMEFPGMKLP